MIGSSAKYFIVEDKRFDIEIVLFDFREHSMENDFPIARE